jgi:hypothetical protein
MPATLANSTLQELNGITPLKHLGTPQRLFRVRVAFQHRIQGINRQQLALALWFWEIRQTPQQHVTLGRQNRPGGSEAGEEVHAD